GHNHRRSRFAAQIFLRSQIPHRSFLLRDYARTLPCPWIPTFPRSRLAPRNNRVSRPDHLLPGTNEQRRNRPNFFCPTDHERDLAAVWKEFRKEGLVRGTQQL